MGSGEAVSWRRAVEDGLQVLAGRWVVAILAALAQGPLRSNALLNEINAAGGRLGRRGQPLDHRVLKDTTNRLGLDGLLVEHDDPTPHPYVLYELTSRGLALLVCLRPLAKWARSAPDGERLSWREAVELAVDALRGVWVLPILAALAQGPLRSGELRTEINSAEAARQDRADLDFRVLKDTTTRLIGDGLLIEHSSPTRSLVRYELTQRGQALVVAVRPLADWASTA